MKPRAALCLFAAFAVLAAVLVYLYRGPLAPPPAPEDLARYERGGAELNRLAAAVQHYRSDRGAFPRSLSDLVPRYLDAVPLDPWGRPYAYRAGGGKATLRFLGRDGESYPAAQPVDRDLVVVLPP
jgi:general secretion pathway protein G